MPLCPRCNKVATEDAMYCPYCGYKIRGNQVMRTY
ncbi:MAG: zinc-ribbon domain-containing protein [Candidatus Nezhaarchaeales archaeon]